MFFNWQVVQFFSSNASWWTAAISNTMRISQRMMNVPTATFFSFPSYQNFLDTDNLRLFFLLTFHGQMSPFFDMLHLLTNKNPFSSWSPVLGLLPFSVDFK